MRVRTELPSFIIYALPHLASKLFINVYLYYAEQDMLPLCLAVFTNLAYVRLSAVYVSLPACLYVCHLATYTV